MTVLWCVGCGDLGTSIGEAMQHAGWQVLGLRRTPPPDAAFEQVAVDVLVQPERLKRLPAPDYVVYTVTPPQRTESAYIAAYDTGVRNVLAQLPATLRRFILVSSSGVYHQSGGEWVDELSPCLPSGFSSNALFAGERHLLDSGLPGTIVRCSGIYGPGRNRLIERALQGMAAVKEPPTYTNRIHRDDAVGFIAHLLRLCHAGTSLENLYLGTDNDPATEWDVMTTLADMLGLPPPPEKPGSADQNKRLRNQRLKDSGYQLQYPGFRDGYAAMIRERNAQP